MPSLHFSSDDPFAVLPADNALSAGGEESFTGLKFAKSTLSGSKINVDAAGDFSVKGDTSTAVIVNVGPPSRLLALAPGMSLVKGSSVGFSGAPQETIAGSTYTVTVYITDPFSNPVESISPVVIVEMEDPRGVQDISKDLVGGSTTFGLIFKTGTKVDLSTPSWKITAKLGAGTAYSSHTVAGIKVNPSVAAQLLILVPDETPDPGSPTGKKGAVASQGAGVDFSVTVNLVDQFNNRVSGFDTVAKLNSFNPLDDFSSVPGTRSTTDGRAVFNNVQLVSISTVTGWSIQASTFSGSFYKPGLSSPIKVLSGSPTKVLVLAPGEVALPGDIADGKTDALPSPQTAGVPFTVTVQAADNAFNPTKLETDVRIYNDDIYSAGSDIQTLVQGAKVFQQTLVTARDTVVFGSATTASLVSGRTQPITVRPNAANQIQILIPGEQPAPGRPAAYSQPGEPAGKISSPISAVAGSGFTITLRAVDAYFNLDTSTSPPAVWVETDDPYVASSSTQSLPSGQAVVNFTMNTATAAPGGWRLVATDGPGGFPLDNQSPKIPVNPGPESKLALVLPGQTLADGIGVAGDANLIAGSSFTVTVYATDARWNRRDSSRLVRLTPSDSLVGVQNSALVNGAATFNVTLVTAKNQSLQLDDISGQSPFLNSFVSQTFPVSPGPAEKVLVLAPGMSKLAGTTTGYAGGPINQVAGTTFTVTVELVDHFSNLINSNHLTHVGVSDRYAVQPSTVSLSQGTTTFAVRLLTRSTVAVTAFDVTDGAIATSTLSLYVRPESADQLAILLPGEGLVEGSPSGKSGLPADLTSGQAYKVTVQLVDRFFNKFETGSMPSVRLGSSDPYDDEAAFDAANPLTLSKGTVVFNTVRPVQARSSATLSAVALANAPTRPSSQSSTFTVVAGDLSDFVVVLPGQTRLNGKNTAPVGVLGTPSPQLAGEEFAATIYATDSNFNFVSGAAKNGIQIRSDDPYAQSAWTANMSGGIATASVLLRTGGAHFLTIEDKSFSLPTLNQRDSGSFDVKPNNPALLQILLPDQQIEVGSTGSGRLGSVRGQDAGVTFQVTVNITDTFWNLTPGASQQVRLSASDPFAVFVPTAAVITTSGTFAATLRRSGTSQITVEEYLPLANSPALTRDVSDEIRVAAGQAKSLVALLPGQTFLQGSEATNGRVGTSLPQSAGIAFNVTVAVVDEDYNIKSNKQATIQITMPTDPYVVAPSTKGFSANDLQNGFTVVATMLHKAAQGHYLVTKDLSGGLAADPQSSTFTVTAAKPVGLQVVLPGQTVAQGSGDYTAVPPKSGISGKPVNQVAGQTFNATVNLVDQYMNRYDANLYNLTSITPLVTLQSGDAYDVEPTLRLTTNGFNIFPMKLVSKSTAVALAAVTSEAVCTGNIGTPVCLTGYPVGRTDEFQVYASTAVGLQILLPGESLNPGHVATLGKKGTLGVYTMTDPETSMAVVVNLVDAYYNVATAKTGIRQDTLPIPTMPEIVIKAPSDPYGPLLNPTVQTLSEDGSATFFLRPRLAVSTYVVTATSTPGSSFSVLPASSSFLTVDPGPIDHFAFSSLPSTAEAGVAFDVTVEARDRFENLISTGDNVYVGTIAFSAPIFSDKLQKTDFKQGTTSFLRLNVGRLELKKFVTLKRANGDWDNDGKIDVNYIQVQDAAVAALKSPVTYINVKPGAANSVRVNPAQDTIVAAGEVLNPGFSEISAQVADAYNNPVSSRVLTTLEIVDISSTPGAGGQYFVWDNPADDPDAGLTLSLGVSTQGWSDEKGRIGRNSDLDNTNPRLGYVVSNKAGDAARVWVGTGTAPGDLSTYKAESRNVSGQLTTKGGSPKKLSFVNPAAVIGAGLLDITRSPRHFSI